MERQNTEEKRKKVRERGRERERERERKREKIEKLESVQSYSKDRYIYCIEGLQNHRICLDSRLWKIMQLVHEHEN